MSEKTHKIRPINNGTAIDHLPPMASLKLYKILDIGNNPVTMAINVSSKRYGKKDLFFIEDRKLNSKEIEKIALIGKNATINIIEKSKIIRKEAINMPKKVRGIIQCINPNCITNVETFEADFTINENPLQAKCSYCETRMNEADIIKRIK